MNTYEKSLKVLEELFGRDDQFSLATVRGHSPSIRVVDTYYSERAFWIVTYALSNKVKEIEENPNVALCKGFYNFTGKAYNAGHPLEKKNLFIREKLVEAFKPWYFAHNNEGDENMCYIKVELEKGFFHRDGRGYKVDFINQQAETFPFAPDVLEIG